MEFQQIINERRSVKKFDASHEISDATLIELFSRVALSPSSFNLQHWRFVVVRDAAHKAQLRKASYNQEQVEIASATIVVAAKLNAHQDASRIFADAPQSVQDSMIPMIHSTYEGKPEFQRDEAVRSTSLAAMSLMYAAYDLGYATGPMIGFDPAAVSELVGLDDDHFPVMLIVIGKEVGDMRPRSARLPINEIVKMETLDGAGLGANL